jgi:exopolysaccharide biosynthesis polyprenyl glycosylphosphotransferase
LSGEARARRPAAVDGPAKAAEPHPVEERASLQPPTLEPRYRVLLCLADSVAAALAAVMGATALEALDPTRAEQIEVRHLVVSALSLVMSLYLHGLYRLPASRLRPTRWWRPLAVARCVPTATLLSLGVGALPPFEPRMTLSAAVAMTLPAVVLVPGVRRTAARLFGPPVVARLLIVGTGQVADRLAARLRRCDDTQIVGQVDDDPAPRCSVLGGLDDLPNLCRQHQVDRVIVAFSTSPAHTTLAKLRRLQGQVPISVVPRLFELHSWRSEIEEIHGLPLLHVPPATHAGGARIAKRVIDLMLAGFAIVVAVPFALALAIAIKLDSPGPVFFRQERVGRGGRRFRIYKFRTMTADAWERRSGVSGANEVDGPLFKIHNDPRVTRLGQALRRTSIDELPQLLNVVRGEMSLVGPRPLPTEESDRLDGAALIRFDVAPGITGLWQVSGRSDLSYVDLQHLDSVYVGSWSLMWDLRIMWETPRSVFGRHGAY